MCFLKSQGKYKNVIYCQIVWCEAQKEFNIFILITYVIAFTCQLGKNPIEIS